MSHATVADGLKATLYASEPMIVQPEAIEFDDRGRLWVIQYLQYPNPAGLSRVKVDRYSRTVYDKIPEPPPRGPKGADRITILEDTDGDGHADKAKDFVNGLNLASGLAFGHGGVFVLQVPYLLFYPDRNGDDVPDSDPEVLLSGFGMEDAHSVANSLTWGPDGWLYGCQGSTVTANIRGIEFQQGVWRYHPITHRFELFCEGGGNSWGLDFDEDGELIYSTNLGPYRMLHGVQGGYYWKSFGKHGALHNPYTYGYFEHMPYENFTGGHVTDGGIIYQGDSFPEKFRGKYIAGDLLGHTVQWHNIQPWGSTFKSGYGGELLDPHDTWCAPTDVTMGPDGSIYVADWFDKRTAHPDPDADWDRSNGRIYRIAAEGRGAPVPGAAVIGSRSGSDSHSARTTNMAAPGDGRTPSFDVSKLPSAKLIELLDGKNDWWVRKARRVLADRRDPKVIAPLRKLIFAPGNPHLSLEALWALYVSGGFNDELAAKLLSHPFAPIRQWTVRLLGDENKVSPAISKRLTQLAESEPDVHVRCQLACTAKRLPVADGLPIVQAILARNLDAQDPYIPLLLWWAVERQCLSSSSSSSSSSSVSQPVLCAFATPTAWQQPMTRSIILERLIRRYAAGATIDSLNACARLLESAPDSAAKQKLLTALDLGLPTKISAELPTQLKMELTQIWSDAFSPNSSIPKSINPLIQPLVRVLARLGDRRAREQALALAANHSASTELRAAMLSLVGELAEPADAGALLALAATTEPEVVRAAALSALQGFPDAELDGVLASYPTMNAHLRGKTRDLFLSRKSWTREFLNAIDAGKIAATEVPVEELRKVASHQDRQLDDLVRKQWGNITRGTPEEKLADVRRFNNDLRAFSGDPVRGRELFTKTCGVCHRLYNEGAQIGPDLTGANRKDRDYLLVNIVDPSATIRKEYLNYNLETTDGRTLTGLIAEQSADQITLVAANAERTTVRRDQIKSLNESSVSLMPENLLSALKPQELRDLFSYLQSDKPPASGAQSSNTAKH
jgi:putative membrane-bound dehydrogenase-like protein